ncbi:MAG: hypothetical protein M1818_005177 [Claussenomyces sp. TS43310]|nr:MAG: hypothetical protein M1818_005177 [Claussenomyces sp. TS43310]
MLPLVDDEILQDNPRFAALHKTLTTSALNADGSTRDHPTQKEREARAEVLQTHRFRAAKHTILRTALSSLPLATPHADTSSATNETPQPELGPDLIELAILLTLTLQAASGHQRAAASPSPSQTLLLEWALLRERLPAHLAQLGALVSAQLGAQALPLARILAPSTNASYLHRQILEMPRRVAALQARRAEREAALQTARLALVPRVQHLWARYRLAMILCIQILERTVHGQVARSAKVRSELLALEVRTKAAEASILLPRVRDALYTPEVRGALRVYAEHLRDGRARLNQREKEARRELERYGVGRDDNRNKDKIMHEVARVYGEMGREVEGVREDLERLKGS